MSKRKKPFDLQQHNELGKAIDEATEILSPFVQKLWNAYPLRSKQARILQQALYLISNELSNEMDKEWYNLLESSREHDICSHLDNPYFGKNKQSWMKPHN